MNKKKIISISDKQYIESENAKTKSEPETILILEYSLFKKKAHINRNHLLNIQQDNLGVNKNPTTENQTFFKVAYYQKDDLLPVNENGGADLNYGPNSFNNIVVDNINKESPMHLQSNIAD